MIDLLENADALMGLMGNHVTEINVRVPVMENAPPWLIYPIMTASTDSMMDMALVTVIGRKTPCQCANVMMATLALIVH